MKHLFQFVDTRDTSGDNIDCEPGLTNAIARTVQKVQSGSGLNGSKAPTLLPIKSTIDVTNDFKWTKTSRNSIGRLGTPTIELEELYVVRPAFYSNLNLFIDQINIGTDLVGNAGADLANSFGFGGAGETISQVTGKVTSTLSSLQTSLNDAGRKVFKGDTINPRKYLKAYEELYGIRKSGFNYRLPYLEDKLRSVSSSWGDDQQGVSFLQNLPLVGNFATTVKSLFSAVTPAVGIDYSKSYAYGGDAPNYSFSFYLDNTKDSEYASMSNLQQNLELIILLMYQNLPNKLNRIAIAPPVIYRANLPGVFYFNYSYMSNLNVEFVGVRREKQIVMPLADGGDTSIPMVVPEGYKVEITLTSLLPESRNLMYTSLDDRVVASEETPNNTLIQRDDLGISTTNTQAGRQRTERNTPR